MSLHSIKTLRIFFPALLLIAGFSQVAHAQIPVTDVGAVVQLVTQVKTLAQQLQTIQNQLTQARQEYQSITGPRGMQNLLSGMNRNYLPTTWAQLQGTLNGAMGTYGALSMNIQTLIAGNSVLTATNLSAMSPAERNAIQAQRQSAALRQAVSQQALATTSSRFSSLQQLISAIPAATDQKGILELQARIGAEQGMLQNEQTKLQMVLEAAQADEAAQHQRLREQAIADSGNLRRLPPLGL